MRIGIIGLGMMGRTHYEAYNQIGGQVVAVADQDPKQRRRATFRGRPGTSQGRGESAPDGSDSRDDQRFPS